MWILSLLLASSVGSLWLSQPAPSSKASVVGEWTAEGGKLRIEFTKDGRFRIQNDRVFMYQGEYELLGADEIGLNRITRADGKFVSFPYMSGRRAEVVIKTRRVEEALILEPPKLREWTLVIGAVRIPPAEGTIRLVRLPEKTKDGQ
jgi:hypothetical protein